MQPLLLPLPHLVQPKDGECLPTCAAMVLAWYGKQVSITKLSKLFGTSPYGTPGSRIKRLAKWGVDVAYKQAEFDEIKVYLANKTPVIALVDTLFLTYWHERTFHAVVVVGVDGDTVYINDPAFVDAPQPVHLDGFLAAWIEQSQMVAIIRD